MANIKKQKSDIVDEMIIEASNPFSDVVMGKPFPEKFKLPTLALYNGTTNLADHIKAFSS